MVVSYSGTELEAVKEAFKLFYGNKNIEKKNLSGAVDYLWG